MSTLRISNIEAKSVPASATIDEKVKITNSSGDTLVFIDGKTSGITTVGINTTDSNITFDANSNVVVTGIITATRFSGQITPTSLEIGSNIKLGNAGVITATSFVGSGANLTSLPTQVTINTNADNRVITGGSGVNLYGESGLTYDGSQLIVRGSDTVTSSGGTKTVALRGGDANDEKVNLSFETGAGGPIAVISGIADATGVYPNTTGSLTFNTQVGGGVFERLRIASDGRTLINTTAVTNTHDFLTVKRPASGFGEMSMTVDANTSTNSAANAFIFTKSKHTYWNGYGFQSSHGHIGAIVGKRDSAGGDSDQEIRIEIGGTHINQSEEKTWNFKNNGNLEISAGNLKLANGYGIDFSSTANYGTSQNESLSDYEEGGWNPTYTTSGGSTGSVSYSHQAGWYVKIGNVVWVMIDITVSSASGMSGNVVIGNHPFNSNIRQGQGYYYSGTSNWTINSNFCYSKPVFTGWMMGNTNKFRIHAGDHWGSVPNAALNQTGRMSFSHYYTTDQY